MSFIFLIGMPYALLSQQADTTNVFNLPVSLDSFVVRSGFDIRAFIRRVQNDTTFYKATKSMHLVPYVATNEIAVYNKREEVVASLNNKTIQKRKNNCRTVQISDEHITGDFLKANKEYQYYTGELFAYLFFINKPVCNETDIVGESLSERKAGQLEKSKYELKQLLFNPGSKISGIPFMGDRASIFDESESIKYNFKVEHTEYDNEPCFVFKITPKEGYESRVIYNDLTTWFRQSDYSIVARDYSLSYHTLVYDFDVRMKVRTRQMAGKLYPTRIEYDGNWHIFTKKRERVKFKVDIAY